MSRFAVILPAAGKSARFAAREKKVFSTLVGKPVWLRSAERFANRNDVVQTIVVVAPEDEAWFRERYAAHVSLLGVEIALGGAERFDSVANGLALTRDDVQLVAIHDAARPCVPDHLVEAVFRQAAQTGAAMLAVPVVDTVKRVDDQGRVEATVPRAGLWLAQTPQVFFRDWLLDAYARRATLGVNVTDDAQLLEAAGFAVHLVTGSSANLKITTAEDLTLAEAILTARPKPQPPKPAHPFEDEPKW